MSKIFMKTKLEKPVSLVKLSRVVYSVIKAKMLYVEGYESSNNPKLLSPLPIVGRHLLKGKVYFTVHAPMLHAPYQLCYLQSVS